MKCLGNFLRPVTSRCGARWAADVLGAYLPLVAHFVLVLLFLLQVDLERELEHKEALLAHCMKREAEEVWEQKHRSAHQTVGLVFPFSTL